MLLAIERSIEWSDDIRFRYYHERFLRVNPSLRLKHGLDSPPAGIRGVTTYQSEEVMKVRVSLRREDNHIKDLLSATRSADATLLRRHIHTQKMAPTAAVSMAVLMSLSMMVSVSGKKYRQASITLSDAEGEGQGRTAEAGLASTQVEEQNHAKRGRGRSPRLKQSVPMATNART